MSEVIKGVRMEKGPTILLNSGHYFDLLAPENSTFTPYDLILGIARECRFANQCEPRYVVCEHSVHVSRVIMDRYGDPQLAWDALWHDSPEGIIRDIVRPQKMLLPDYKALENRVEPVLFDRLRVIYPLHPIIKDYDLRAQYCEKAQVEPHKSHWPRETEPEMIFTVWGVDERTAIGLFLDMAISLAAALEIDFDPRRPLGPGDRL